MLNKYTVQLMALGIAGSFAATAVAEDSALIDALVKKGVLKTKEAEQIRAEAAKGNHSSAGKLNLDSSVKSLTLSGDFRVRYNYASGTGASPNAGYGNGPHSNVAAGHTDQQSFYDLRLRINADYKLSDDFYAGFGVRTQRDARNDNALMGSTSDSRYTPASTTNPHANRNSTDFGLGIYRAFLGWHPVEGVELVAGAQKNPFYTTDLVWDVDLNPTGFSQKIDLNKTFGVSGVDLSLVSGQFILWDNIESSAVSNENRDAFLWQTQVVAGVELGGAKLTVAPGYLSTNGGGFNASNYLSDTQVLLFPGDVSGEVAGIKAKFEWDFAYNVSGEDRSLNAHNGNGGTIAADKSQTSDKLAWLLGVRLGENKKRGDFSVLANYRRIGAGALMNGMNDNEFAFGNGANMGGFKVGAAYSVSDSAYFGVNYLRFEKVSNKDTRNNIGFATGEWLQAEVGVKF
jgi:hypothetical protein